MKTQSKAWATDQSGLKVTAGDYIVFCCNLVSGSYLKYGKIQSIAKEEVNGEKRTVLFVFSTHNYMDKPFKRMTGPEKITNGHFAKTEKENIQGDFVDELNLQEYEYWEDLISEVYLTDEETKYFEDRGVL